MKVTLFEFEHRGEGTYFSCYVPTKLNLNEFGNLASGDLLIDDCRMISRKQQKMIYALFADISEYSGHPVDFLKDFMKSKFIAEYGGEWFSLGYVNMQKASVFIDFIIRFMFTQDIHFSDGTVPLLKEVTDYIYYCIMNGKCVCCQKDKRTIGMHLHHTNAVGMGRDKKKIDHSKHKFLMLCAVHHKEAHDIGQQTFNNKYHLDGIKLSKDSLVELRLMKKCDLTELNEAEAEGY